MCVGYDRSLDEEFCESTSIGYVLDHINQHKVSQRRCSCCTVKLHIELVQDFTFPDCIIALGRNKSGVGGIGTNAAIRRNMESVWYTDGGGSHQNCKEPGCKRIHILDDASHWRCPSQVQFPRL